MGCTLQVIWDGHIPGLFSRATLRIIWAWQLYPPGLFEMGTTLQVIFPGHPPGYLGLAILLLPSGLFGMYILLGCTLRVIWAGHPLILQAILTKLLCPRHDHPMGFIWGLTTLWTNAPSRLFGPGYPLAWIICRVILGSAASASQFIS